MNLTRLLATLTCLTPLTAMATELSLDDVLLKAAGKTHDRILIEQSYKSSMADVDIVTSSALPQITSEITTSRMSLSTVGQTSGFGSAGSSQGYGLQQQQQNPADFPERVYGSAYGFGVNLRTPVYAFGRIGTLYDIKEQHVTMLGESRKTQIEQYYLRVIQAYSEAVLNLNRYQAATRAESHARAVADFTKVEYEGGGRSRVDFLRAKSFASLALADKQRTQNLHATSIERLKVLIDIPADQALELRPGVDGQISFLRLEGLQRGNRLDIKLKEMEAGVNELWADYRKASIWPTLYLVGGVNNSLNQIDYGAFKTNENADPQDVFAQNRHNYTLGLALSWTLFDGFRTTSEARKAVAASVKSKIELEKLRREDATARIEASENVRVAELVFQAATQAEAASRLAFEQTESDYKAGTVSLTEMLEVQRDLSETENQLFEAYANKIMAVANYKWVHGIALQKRKPGP